MGAANIPSNVRGKVVIETIKCDAQLDGLSIVEIKGVSQTRDKHVYGKLPKWSKNLRTFGEAGVAKDGKDGKQEIDELR